ncbi:Tripeptidase T [Staphylococcus aureus]|uniref:Tripeptidase T n=1 Tax=Staphylococcus aureus TaxID=1280 RepID=A0A380EJI8_STAAU|nr:Tripeptidase T [Staphylococcus aureus]
MTDVFETTASELGGKAVVTVEQSYPGFKINDNEAVVKIAQESARNLGLSANTIFLVAVQTAVLLIHLVFLQSF